MNHIRAHSRIVAALLALCLMMPASAFAATSSDLAAHQAAADAARRAAAAEQARANDLAKQTASLDQQIGVIEAEVGALDGQIGTATDRRTKKKLARPRLYKVLFHNDDFTTKWFVVAVLEQIFHHTEAQANTIMTHVHETGIGVAGVFTFEIAETKVAQTMQLAREHEFPLQVTLEPEE